MAKIDKSKYLKEDKNKKKTATYKNPVNTIWGKILIFILAFAMCFGSLATLIYLMCR